jgi:hypothetical protein
MQLVWFAAKLRKIQAVCRLSFPEKLRFLIDINPNPFYPFKLKSFALKNLKILTFKNAMDLGLKSKIPVEILFQNDGTSN